MNPPLPDRIVGSWEFSRCTQPDGRPGDSYFHFTADRLWFWEVFLPEQPKRLYPPKSYFIRDDHIVVIWPTAEIAHPIRDEGNGTLRFTAQNGYFWWMSKVPFHKEPMQGFENDKLDELFGEAAGIGVIAIFIASHFFRKKPNQP